MDRAEKEAIKGFVNDVNGSEDKQPGFDERGEIFKLAVAVRVALVRRPVGDTHREKRDDRGDEVEAGMQGLGKNAEAVRAKDQKSFQTEQQHGRANA